MKPFSDKLGQKLSYPLIKGERTLLPLLLTFVDRINLPLNN